MSCSYPAFRACWLSNLFPHFLKSYTLFLLGCSHSRHWSILNYPRPSPYIATHPLSLDPSTIRTPATVLLPCHCPPALPLSPILSTLPCHCYPLITCPTSTALPPFSPRYYTASTSRPSASVSSHFAPLLPVT